MATTKSNVPSEYCKATKEELLNQKKNPLDVSDDCPVCARRNVFCEVGCHPSTASSASGKPGPTGVSLDASHSWTKMYKRAGLLCHRPIEGCYGIHVSLMSRALGKLYSDVRDIELFRDDYKFVREFCAAMCQAYGSEAERMVVANKLLTGYLGAVICPIGDGKCTKDGAVMMQCGSSASNTMAGVIIVYKAELCSTRSSPGEQSIAYYMKSALSSSFARARSTCPALLMTIAGPNLGISAVVQAAGTCVDPVVPLLPTLVLKYDKGMMATLGRALKAAKVCIENLTAFYAALKDEEPSMLDVEQLVFPYPRTFTFDKRSVPFTYNSTLGGEIGKKLVFRATVDPGDHSLVPGLSIVVKFTDTYCVDAHNCCYSFERSAPRLLAHDTLHGGWHMIVMESLSGADFRPQQELAQVKEQLRRAVSQLHEAGFVHGDLRQSNIRVVGERVCLIDFDWSGRAGEARYPGFMNHVDIEWAPGASDGLALQPDHDEFMLKRLVG